MDGQIEKYMKAALKEAEKAAAEDEVPVGAVAVCGGKIIAKAHNKKEQKSSATRHAEIELFRRFRYAGTVRYVHGSNDKRAYQVTVFWGLGTQNRVLRFFVRFPERQKIQSQLPRTRRDNGGGMFPDPVRLFQGEAYQKTGQLTERINFSKS